MESKGGLESCDEEGRAKEGRALTLPSNRSQICFAALMMFLVLPGANPTLRIMESTCVANVCICKHASTDQFDISTHTQF